MGAGPGRFWLWLPLLLLILLAGCAREDTLESIRERQRAGDFASTVEPLRERLEKFPKDAETQYFYGRALVATQQPELALFVLREAMNDPDWGDRAAIQTALASLASGDYNEAVLATSEVLERDPDNVEALLYRAQARAHWHNEPELALEDAERVLDIDPDRIEAYEPMILALLSLDRPVEATEALEEAGRRLVDIDASEDQLAWHCNTTAIFASDMGEPEKAASQIESCLERFPSNFGVIDNALKHFDRLGDFERGLEVIRVAHELEPANRAYRGLYAARLSFAGRTEEAESMLRAATLTESPAEARYAWVDLAELLKGQGDFPAAAEAFEKAVELYPKTDPELTFRYVDTLVLAEDLDRATEMAATLPVEAHRLLIEARIAQIRGDDAKALEGFVAAAQLWPNNPTARYYAGFSAARLGDWDRALEEFRYSIRIDTGATDSRTQAAKILAAQGDLSGAYHALFIQAADFPLEPEGMILGAYLIARVSNPSQLQDMLLRHRSTHPPSYPRALVSAARGLGENGLPAAGMNLLSGAPGLDWSKPDALPVIMEFIRLSKRAGRSAEAEVFLDSLQELGVAAPGILEVARAFLAEQSGGPPREVMAAYRKASELVPDQPEVWIAIGRLSLGTRQQDGLEGGVEGGLEDFEQALAAFDRALVAAQEAAYSTGRRAEVVAEVQRGRARALVGLGRNAEAAEVLDSVITEDPLDREAAIARVELDLASGAASDRTIELAERAARFGRTIEDYRRLAGVYRAAGDDVRAVAAENAVEQAESAEAARRAEKAEEAEAEGLE